VHGHQPLDGHVERLHELDADPHPRPLERCSSGRIDAVFTGDAPGGRAGTLTFVESLSIDASGGTSIRGHITNSSGALAGSSGHASWIGISAQDGSGSGTYSRRWREGHRRGA